MQNSISKSHLLIKLYLLKSIAKLLQPTFNEFLTFMQVLQNGRGRLGASNTAGRWPLNKKIGSVIPVKINLFVDVEAQNKFRPMEKLKINRDVWGY